MTISHDIVSISTGLSVFRLAQQAVEVGATGGIVTLSTIRVKNDGTEIPTGAEFTVLTAGLSIDGTPVDGKECVVEKWIEAKPSGGEWTPIGNGDSVTIPSLAVNATTDIEMRINVPAGASMLGTIEPAICAVVW